MSETQLSIKEKIREEFMKCAGPSTKITTIRVPLEDSALGLKRADVNIRNATGGVDKPVIKINLF